MTTCDRSKGFTLLEIIIVLGVLGVLLAAAAPLAGAVIDANRRDEVQRELGDIGAALEAFYYDNAAFPAALTDSTFFGIYLQPGVSGASVIDPFAAGQGYRYTVSTTANTATVYSIGEDRRDRGAASEEFVTVVHGAVPGARRTQQRLRIVVEVLANYIESGAAVTGTWPALRAAMGLGSQYDKDGWGTVLQWDAATHTLTSAGPDRSLGTADDITI